MRNNGLLFLREYSAQQRKNNKYVFSFLETRGRDASGFAFIDDGELVVHKAPIKSSDMIKTDEWKKLTLPKIMILHCQNENAREMKRIMQTTIHCSQTMELQLSIMELFYNDKEIFGKKAIEMEK